MSTVTENPYRNRNGFTLIEMLVAIAIMALLFSVLVPSLRQVRAQAQAVACGSNQRQLGQLCKVYQATHKGYLPGSPWTSGYAITQTGVWDPSLPGFSSRAIEWMDYATSLRAEVQTSMPDAENGDAKEIRKQLYRLATDDYFHCPSNPHLAVAWGDDSGGFPVIYAPSYLTMWTIMRAGPTYYDTEKIASFFGTGPAPGFYSGYVAQSQEWELVPPDDYFPRADKVGKPYMKVFLADGLRFYDSSSGVIDYNVALRGAKGMMSAEPPSSYSPDVPANSREYVMAKEFSYRHGDNNQINALFLDGHVERLRATTNSDGPFKGTAVHPKHYYPSHTVVKDNGKLHLDIPEGTVLP